MLLDKKNNKLSCFGNVMIFFTRMHGGKQFLRVWLAVHERSTQQERCAYKECPAMGRIVG